MVLRELHVRFRQAAGLQADIGIAVEHQCRLFGVTQVERCRKILVALIIEISQIVAKLHGLGQLVPAQPAG